MRSRMIHTNTCEGCGIRFATYDRGGRFHNRSCAAKARARTNPEQLAIARACRKPPRPKPDVTVFDVPVFRAPPRPAVEEPAPLPPVPAIDHASRVMLGWAGARI